MVEKGMSSDDSNNWDDPERAEMRGGNYTYKMRKEFMNENFDDNK